MPPQPEQGREERKGRGPVCGSSRPAVDDFLAATLRGEALAWPFPDDRALDVAHRATYHGIGGLLLQANLSQWPAAARHVLRDQAVAAAMWEMRHRIVVMQCVAALAAAGIPCILLKGTAFAYDLYDRPAYRSRGDTDLLIRASDLETAQAVLVAEGYARNSSDTKRHEDLQELWVIAHEDGSLHEIDLHWQIVDAPALTSVLPTEYCFSATRPLPALGPDAMALALPEALVHSCVHRAKHLSSPYYSGETVHYSADRLIWSHDIDLLAKALDGQAWAKFVMLTLEYGLAAIALDGLGAAARDLATPTPQTVTDALNRAPHDTPASRFLMQPSALLRGIGNVRAVGGLRGKLLYMLRRLFPGDAYVRVKYPDMQNASLYALYWRRIKEAAHRPGPERN